MSERHIPVPLARVTDAAYVFVIAPGMRVRSYDFEFHPDCYVEGIVRRRMFNTDNGCSSFEIEVYKRVWDGQERPGYDGEYVYPPVNGMRVWGSDELTNGVQPVEGAW